MYVFNMEDGNKSEVHKLNNSQVRRKEISLESELLKSFEIIVTLLKAAALLAFNIIFKEKEKRQRCSFHST